MKQTVFIILFSLSYLNLFSQEDENIIKSDITYYVHLPILVNKCGDIECNTVDSTHTVIDKGNTFYVLEMRENGDAIIQFWLDDKYSPTEKDKKFAYDSVKKERNTFLIKKKDIQNKTRRRYITGLGGLSITGGVTFLPFKIRPKVIIDGQKTGFDFSKDIQLGISGGVRYRISRYNPYFINGLLNVGISSVTLDAYNTRGTITDNLDIAALTYAAGVVLDFNKIQFGIFAGKDLISDRNRNNWIYQGKTWWSVGFGFSIFSITTKPISQNNN